jgi:hypothetical protein
LSCVLLRRCYMAKQHLSALELKAQLRTLERQQLIRRRIAETRATHGKTAARAVGSTYGTHPDECGLCGWAGQHRIACELRLVGRHCSNSSEACLIAVLAATTSPSACVHECRLQHVRLAWWVLQQQPHVSTCELERVVQAAQQQEQHALSSCMATEERTCVRDY